MNAIEIAGMVAGAVLVLAAFLVAAYKPRKPWNDEGE